MKDGGLEGLPGRFLRTWRRGWRCERFSGLHGEYWVDDAGLFDGRSHVVLVSTTRVRIILPPFRHGAMRVPVANAGQLLGLRSLG